MKQLVSSIIFHVTNKGCHIKKFKQSTIKQIQLLKDIWNCKSTKFDADAAEHQMLLLRLWSSLMSGTGSTLGNKGEVPLVGEHWKVLGFQGTNPATDFRGMGLLGLLNLIYFAGFIQDVLTHIKEKYSERANKILRNKREYPFAVTGINITSTLLNLLNLTKGIFNLLIYLR